MPERRHRRLSGGQGWSIPATAYPSGLFARRLVVACFLLTLLGACLGRDALVDNHSGPGWYTVKRSDTLYSIAWRYGLDFEQLARWNQINTDSIIFPGQRLRLIEPAAQPPVLSSGGGEGVESNSGTPAKPVLAPATATKQDLGQDPSRWIWPTRGKPLNTFAAARLDRRGIDIAGKAGQPVRAVANGKVVYSGNGLAGYGNLLIIKHSDAYLSAYAYCQERLVEEGAMVKAGSEVARMGVNNNKAMLHFEIRKNGKPVDPLKYLP